MKVLITGGAGYIGSTIASCCSDSGIEPIILDDLSAGRRDFAERYTFYEADVADVVALSQIFDEHPDIYAIIHCAAKIVVPESVARPLDYYENNVSKSIVLARIAAQRGIRRIIFSSTAAMYDAASGELVDEASPVNPGSPYATSKWMVERVLADLAATGKFHAISLRYFNPIGADPEMRTGLQNLSPTHALGKLMEAHRQREPFMVTGTNWPTRDGSGLRDYIHVWDLARAHVAAVEKFDAVLGEDADGFEVINLGTGSGTTVFELVEAFEAVVGESVEVHAASARPGDLPGCAPSTERARLRLGWGANFNVADGISHSLRWRSTLTARTRGRVA